MMAPRSRASSSHQRAGFFRLLVLCCDGYLMYSFLQIFAYVLRPWHGLHLRQYLRQVVRGLCRRPRSLRGHTVALEQHSPG